MRSSALSSLAAGLFFFLFCIKCARLVSGQVQASNQYREGTEKIKILVETDTSQSYTSLDQEQVRERELIEGRDADTPMTAVIDKNEDFIRSVEENVQKYVTVDPEGYSVSLILDPCRGKSPVCCNDTYGTGEYFDSSESDMGETYVPQVERVCEGYSMGCSKSPWNEQLDEKYSRLANFQVLKDPLCETEFEEGSSSSTTCISESYRKIATTEVPDCWDRNDTVNAMNPCRSVDSDGVSVETCLEVGYSSTAYVMTCREQESNNCGTFLEIHQPGNPYVISETKLPEGLLSGYRMTNISARHAEDLDRIICRGDYELWWVQRVPRSDVHYLKYVKPFRVEFPVCKYDGINGRYFEYAIVDESFAAQVAAYNGGWFEYIVFNNDDARNEDTLTSYQEVIDKTNVFLDETGVEHEGTSLFFSSTSGETSFDLPDGSEYRTENEWFTFPVDDAFKWQTSFAFFEGNRRTGSTRELRSGSP
eukprot:g4524.t1